MDYYYNCNSVRDGELQFVKSQENIMDVSSKTLVGMDNRKNNIIGCKNKEDDFEYQDEGYNEFYDILWKSHKFVKKLTVLKKMYKKLRNESDPDRKVGFLKMKDKLLREKPLNVMGLKVQYSDTSVAISEENQLPPFRMAILTDIEVSEEKERQKEKLETFIEIEDEVIEEEEESMEEESMEEQSEEFIVKPRRTTVSRKHYEKNRNKKIAKLKEQYRDLREIRKSIPMEEIIEEIQEEIPEVPPEPIPIVVKPKPQPKVVEEEKVIKESVTPPKPKKRVIKKAKKKTPRVKKPPPSLPSPPPIKLRTPLPTDKRRVSDSDAKQKQLSREKRRWSADDRYTHTPNKIDLSPLNIKLPELDQPPLKLRTSVPPARRRVSDFEAMSKKKQLRELRKRRWSFDEKPATIKIDISALNIKLPEQQKSIISLMSITQSVTSLSSRNKSLSGQKIGKLGPYTPTQKQHERKLNEVGKLKIPETFA